MIEPGTIPAAFVGGAIIGLAAALMLALNGRILGVSGIAADLVSPFSRINARTSGMLFLAGMVLGGIAVGHVLPQALPGAITGNRGMLLAAGLAVGVGTRVGGGCTSGHGVCGMARLAPRSLLATAVFMLSAMATVYVVRHAIGGVS